MSKRKYSVMDIDRMRAAIYARMFPRSPTGFESFFGSYEEQMSLRAEQVERRLHTYMLNGTSPEDLEEGNNVSQPIELLNGSEAGANGRR